MTRAGLPHSGISGSTLVCNSPELIAAYHALHRLLTPRHPPCALSSLVKLLSTRDLPCGRPQVLGISEDAYPTFPIRLSKSRIEQGHGLAAAGRFSQGAMRCAAGARPARWDRPRRPDGATAGGDSRDRTGSLRLAKPALSQLSYIPERCGAERTCPRSVAGPGRARPDRIVELGGPR